MEVQHIVFLVVAGMGLLAGILALLNFYIWYREKHNKKRFDELGQDVYPVHKNLPWHIPSFDDKRVEDKIVERLRKNLQRSGDDSPKQPDSDVESGSSTFSATSSTNMLFQPKVHLKELITKNDGYTVTL